MSVLSDRDLKYEMGLIDTSEKLGEVRVGGGLKRRHSERLIIDPYNPDSLQPASIDLTLWNEIWEIPNHWEIDPYETEELEQRMLSEEYGYLKSRIQSKGLWIKPQTLYIASTSEAVTIPNHLVGRVEGKSSLGRLGLIIHVTAGYVDPGWRKGQITLEIISTNRFKLYPGMPVCQLSVQKLETTCERPYGSGASGSRYQGQQGPQLSRYGHGRVKPSELDSAQEGMREIP